jgi:hypothetical protein
MAIRQTMGQRKPAALKKGIITCSINLYLQKFGQIHLIKPIEILQDLSRNIPTIYPSGGSVRAFARGNPEQRFELSMFDFCEIQSSFRIQYFHSFLVLKLGYYLRLINLSEVLFDCHI